MLLPGYEAYDWKQLSKMTHVEPFEYPVWDGEAMGSIRRGFSDNETLNAVPTTAGGAKHSYVLFDYANRNPLNYEARVIVL